MQLMLTCPRERVDLFSVQADCVYQNVYKKKPETHEQAFMRKTPNTIFKNTKIAISK